MIAYLLRRSSFGKYAINVFVVCTILSIAKVSSVHVIQRKYSDQMNYEMVTFTDRNRSQNMRSEIACAAFCTEDPDCFTFIFDGLRKICHSSSRVVPGGAVPVKHCPIGGNYKVYKEGRFELCLKTDQTKVDQSMAKHYCSVHGGHLALVDNPPKRLFVQKILESISSATLWIDGKDINGDNIMVNWKGIEMSWFEWGRDTEPSNGDQDCMMAGSGNQFRFSDWYCYETRGYICEID